VGDVAVDTVLLDATGTLFEVAEPIGLTYARLARDEGIAGDAAAFEAAFRAAFRAAPPLAFPGLTGTARAAAEESWWLAVVGGALERAGARHGPSERLRFFTASFAHYAAPGAWRVFPEVHAALEKLRGHGYRLAVVSNFDSRLHRLLARLEIDGFFEAVVVSSECGAAKPDRRIFEHALAALGVPPESAVHVGDHDVLDRNAAEQAGLRALLLDRSGRGRPGTIRDLGELLALLRRAPP
jgi:putative hydrolase of the HAD superfamily